MSIYNLYGCRETYDDTNPDWALSVLLGYDVAVPDSSRYNRRKQRSRVSKEDSQTTTEIAEAESITSVENGATETSHYHLVL